MPRHSRVDAELVRRGLARSRQQAAELIGAGKVSIDEMPAVKPGTAVAATASLKVAGDTERGWVSRGAHKLIGALDSFGIDVAGRRCLDAGASTGGFTEVLLDRGARQVVAVDVGYGQLAWSLRSDDRVVVIERTNARELTPEAIDGKAATPANGGTLGFAAESAEQADAWHTIGVAHGGRTCEDPPGVREGATGKFYIAYLRDPDGNKLCALHRMG